MNLLQQKLINHWVDTDGIKEKLMGRQQNAKQGAKLSFSLGLLRLLKPIIRKK